MAPLDRFFCRVDPVTAICPDLLQPPTGIWCRSSSHTHLTLSSELFSCTNEIAEHSLSLILGQEVSTVRPTLCPFLSKHKETERERERKGKSARLRLA